MRKPGLALIAGLMVGTTLTVVVAGSSHEQRASLTTPDPVVTPVAGPSWLNHLGLTYRESSLGRSGATYGPPPTPPTYAPPLTPRPSPSNAAPLAVGKPVVLSGADLYRLNCQACHRAEGTGSPPEIKSVLGLAGSSLELVRQHSRRRKRLPPAAARSDSGAGRPLPANSKAAADVGPRTCRKPISTRSRLLTGLLVLGGATDATTTSWARSASIVKGTCHICHDAVGPRPSGEAVFVQGLIPPLTTLLADKPVADFVTKARSGAPVMTGDPAFHYRGRMPVFSYLQDVEVAAAYMFLVDYPPRAEASRR